MKKGQRRAEKTVHAPADDAAASASPVVDAVSPVVAETVSPVADAPGSPLVALILHFCRLQLPAVPLSLEACQRHLGRTFELYRGKANGEAGWEKFLDNLYPLDWYLASACLEGNARAWEYLFAVRTGRSDCLLVDASAGPGRPALSAQ